MVHILPLNPAVERGALGAAVVDRDRHPAAHRAPRSSPLIISTTAAAPLDRSRIQIKKYKRILRPYYDLVAAWCFLSAIAKCSETTNTIG